jgi:hypothetical protein
MQRRSFLAGLLALPAAGAVAMEVAMEVARGVPKPATFDANPYLTSKYAWYLPDYPARPEISSYNRTSSRLMTAKQMRELLEPGLNEAFSSVYGSSGL